MVRAPWAAQRGARKEKSGRTGREPKSKRDLDGSLLSAFQARIRERLERYRSLQEFVVAMGRTVNAAIVDRSGLVAPYTGPNCILNRALTGRRCIATHAFELARVKAVSKASESTLNDVLLAVSAGALRRYLEEMHELPKRPLTAGVPVGLKHGEGEGSGNRVSLLLGTLATNVRDPLKRLTAIKRSMRAGKKHLMAMSAGRSLVDASSSFDSHGAARRAPSPAPTQRVSRRPTKCATRARWPPTRRRGATTPAGTWFRGGTRACFGVETSAREPWGSLAYRAFRLGSMAGIGRAKP
jgi:hypothetical protein